MIPTILTPPPAVRPLDLFASAGTALFRVGDAATSLFKLREGLVKLSVVTPQGSEHILGFYGADDILGSASLRSPQRHLAEAIAITDVRYDTVSPEHTHHLVVDLEAQLRRSQESLALASAPVIVRLAATLLDLNERFGKAQCETHCRLALPLRHEDYAAAIHATRVSVTTAFAALRQADIVLGQRSDYLIDAPRLRQLTQTWEL